MIFSTIKIGYLSHVIFLYDLYKCHFSVMLIASHRGTYSADWHGANELGTSLGPGNWINCSALAWSLAYRVWSTCDVIFRPFAYSYSSIADVKNFVDTKYMIIPQGY